MGIQVIVKAKAVSDIESALGRIASECEVFPITISHFGLSIPAKVIDSIGEKSIEAALEKLERFDLWAGVWKTAKPKWKIW